LGTRQGDGPEEEKATRHTPIDGNSDDNRTIIAIYNASRRCGTPGIVRSERIKALPSMNYNH